MRFPRGVLAFTLMFVLSASITALAVGRDGSDTTIPPASAVRIRDPMAIFDPSVPLMPHGQRTVIGAVSDAAGFPIVRPAALGEPSESWVVDYGEGVREVGLRYTEQGIVILLARFPEGRDPIRSLRARTRDLPMADTTTIAGYPAAVLPYDPDLAVAPIDVVYVIVDGVEVSIYGDHGKVGIQDLVSAAGSLTTSQPHAAGEA